MSNMSSNTFFNVGTADRAVRAALGLAVIALVFVGPKTPWGYLGLVPLLTAVVGFCPLYAALHLSTRAIGTPK